MKHDRKTFDRLVALSVEQFASQLGVSTGLVRLEIARGRLRASRVGRRVVILRDDAERYLAGHVG